MKEIIDQIRDLLQQLELTPFAEQERAFLENFNALEVPALVSSIIDHLQPVLLPYEAAIYWHLFGKSNLATGQPHARVSVRGLQDGVILSSRGAQSSALSYASVQAALVGLEQKGAITTAGEPNREGTLYKVNLPEEIEVSRQHMQEHAAPERPANQANSGVDYYNVRENRLVVFERDGYRCRYCGKQLTRFTATLDHTQPVSEGGENTLENLVTACLSCNSRKTNRPVMDLLVSPRKPPDGAKP